MNFQQIHLIVPASVIGCLFIHVSILLLSAANLEILTSVWVKVRLGKKCSIIGIVFSKYIYINKFPWFVPGTDCLSLKRARMATMENWSTKALYHREEKKILMYHYSVPYLLLFLWNVLNVFRDIWVKYLLERILFLSQPQWLQRCRWINRLSSKLVRTLKDDKLQKTKTAKK